MNLSSFGFPYTKVANEGRVKKKIGTYGVQVWDTLPQCSKLYNSLALTELQPGDNVVRYRSSPTQKTGHHPEEQSGQFVIAYYQLSKMK